MLSLDHDGQEFLAVGERDPVVARLQAVAPGLRPPLFYSPYEAAAWSVLSARRPAAQMMEVRRRLSEEHGRMFTVAGRPMAAFPTPEQLLNVVRFPGLPELKVRRLHGVAAAGIDGHLDASALRDMEADEAIEQLCRLGGIGPFYSALVMVRASGLTDLLPSDEPKFKELVAKLYGLEGPPTSRNSRQSPSLGGPSARGSRFLFALPPAAYCDIAASRRATHHSRLGQPGLTLDAACSSSSNEPVSSLASAMTAVSASVAADAHAQADRTGARYQQTGPRHW